MRLIYNVFILSIIFLLFDFPVFAAPRENPKEARAREELKNKTEEIDAKQKEITQKEEEITKKKEMGVEAGEKKVQDELVTLNKEQQELLDAKIKAINDLLTFNPVDLATLKAEIKAEQERKNRLEVQIKKFAENLASAGTEITPGKGQAKKSYIEMLFGKEFNTNLKIWTKTKLADFYVYIGDPAKAKKLYTSLAEVYKGLNKLDESKENYLNAEYADFAVASSDTVKNILARMKKYSRNLEKIMADKAIGLKSARNEEDRKRIIDETEQKIKSIVSQEFLEKTVIEFNNLKEKLNDPKVQKMMGGEYFTKFYTLGIDIEFKRIEKDVNIAVQGLSISGMEKNAQNTFRDLFFKESQQRLETLLKDALGGGKHWVGEAEAKGKINFPRGDRIIDEEYAELVRMIDSLKSLDYFLLNDLQKAEKVISQLLKIYKKIDERYEFFTYPSRLQERIGSKTRIQDLIERYQKEHENIISLMAKQQEKSSIEADMQYKTLNEQNKNAKIIDPNKLEKAEISIGNDKKRFEEILQTIKKPDAQNKIDTIVNQLDKKIEELLLEISKADPSQRSVESLKKISDALINMRNQIDAVFMLNELSPEIQVALAKIYLKAQIRGKQISSQFAQDQGSLMTIIGDKLVFLPQVERTNVKELQKVPTTRSQPILDIVEIVKNIWNRQKVDPITFEKQKTLLSQIESVPLQQRNVSSVENNEGQRLVNEFIKYQNPGPDTDEGKTPEKGSTETDIGGWDT